MRLVCEHNYEVLITMHALLQVCVEGRDQEDHPFSFLKSVSFSGADQNTTCNNEPYTVLTGAGSALKLNLVFHSHYGEPPLSFDFDVIGGKHTQYLNYNILYIMSIPTFVND